MEPIRRGLFPPYPLVLSLPLFLYFFSLFDNLPSGIAQMSQKKRRKGRERTTFFPLSLSSPPPSHPLPPHLREGRGGVGRRGAGAEAVRGRQELT